VRPQESDPSNRPPNGDQNDTNFDPRTAAGAISCGCTIAAATAVIPFGPTLYSRFAGFSGYAHIPTRQAALVDTARLAATVVMFAFTGSDELAGVVYLASGAVETLRVMFAGEDRIRR